MPRTVAIIAGVLGSCVLGVAYSADNGIPNLKDPKVILAGRQLYLEKHCSHCHGANGDGGVNLINRDPSNAKYVSEAIARWSGAWQPPHAGLAR